MAVSMKNSTNNVSDTVCAQIVILFQFLPIYKLSIPFISKLTFYLLAFPCFLTYCQLMKKQKAEKDKSCLLLEYNLVANCLLFWLY